MLWALPTSGVCLGLQLGLWETQRTSRARATLSILERTCIPAPLLSLQVLKVPLLFPERRSPPTASPTRELAENQERFALFGIN